MTTAGTAGGGGGSNKEGGSQPCSWCGQYDGERFHEATREDVYLEGRSIRGDNICRVCMLEETVKNLRKEFEEEITRLQKELEEHLAKTT